MKLLKGIVETGIIQADAIVNLIAGGIDQVSGRVLTDQLIIQSQNTVSLLSESNDINILSAQIETGNLIFTNKNQITAQNLIAANVNLSSKTGSINAASIFAENALILNAGDTINKTEGTITAEDAILKAANGIGTQDNSFTIEVNRLDIVNTTSGNIYISNTGELNLIDLNKDGKAIDNAGGGSIETHSPLNVL
ncbi:MAG: hypothetical protein OMM_10294, partial [Candidatus Magnetoglobus multicellularis str. Araruama]